ncbi:retrovirus-related pol polyprotein from transposon TNT 1-94 [Tanacetum coccineum]
MDQDSTHMVATSKVPMLKSSEYEIWKMRIKQYIQMIDYALWEVIENGDAFLQTADEKAQRKIRRNASYKKDSKELLLFKTGQYENSRPAKAEEGPNVCIWLSHLQVSLRGEMQFVDVQIEGGTMLADFLKVANTCWADAVNTAVLCGKRDQEKEDNVNSNNNVNADGTNEVNDVGGKTSIKLPFDPNMYALEDYSIFEFSGDDEMRFSDDMKQIWIQQSKPLKTACLLCFFITGKEPKKVIHAIEEDPSWIEALNGFSGIKRIEKEEIVDKKLSKIGLLSIHTRRKGLTKMEVFSSCFGKELIALGLFVSLCFILMILIGVSNGCKKLLFFYGKIKEEVYVCQPPGFEDPDFPDRVYKSGKLTRPYSSKDTKGVLFLLVPQVYVDDIIFGSTKKELCIAFEKLMHEKFQMSSMGELIFFLGLQVKQKKDDIFISQDKYVEEILKKFGFTEVKTASTPMKSKASAQG